MKDFTKEQKGSKAEFVFKSKTDRFAVKPNSYLNKQNNPGPSDYNAQEPKYINKGQVESKFGSHAGRNSLITRDISKSPYQNPTSQQVPAPSEYAPRSHEMAKEFSPRNTNGFA